MGFPHDVQDHIGFALYQAQIGLKHRDVKPLAGLGSGVLEVVSDFDTNTYRAVYAVRFRDAVYVLHAFQKKSKRGIATPKVEIDLVKRRLKAAEQHHGATYRKGSKR
jgi:phage-related protein